MPCSSGNNRTAPNSAPKVINSNYRFPNLRQGSACDFNRTKYFYFYDKSSRRRINLKKDWKAIRKNGWGKEGRGERRTVRDLNKLGKEGKIS